MELFEAEEYLSCRAYLPEDVDEYSSSSKPLTDIIQSDVEEMATSNCDLTDGYIAEVTREAGMNPCAVMLGLLYMHRMAVKNTKYVTTTSAKDLFLASMMLASKYLNDEGELEALINSDWAEIGMKRKQDIDQLEMEFVDAMNWELYVSLNDYHNFLNRTKARIAQSQMVWRGEGAMYSDLIAIWSSGDNLPQYMMKFATEMTKIVLQSSAVYLACCTALFTTATVVLYYLQGHQLPASDTYPVTKDFSPVDYSLYHSNQLKFSDIHSKLSDHHWRSHFEFESVEEPESLIKLPLVNCLQLARNYSAINDMWYFGIATYIWSAINYYPYWSYQHVNVTKGIMEKDFDTSIPFKHDMYYLTRGNYTNPYWYNGHKDPTVDLLQILV